MSKNKIRVDKTCLNCRHVVENRFCPNCGQENIDTRKSFHHLFIHFFEDLTHYENAFWRTIKNLILRPASLTKEYLSGKRMSYLAPVRLYIFISFVTFFMFSIFSSGSTQRFLEKQKEKSEKQNDSLNVKKDTVYKEQQEVLKLVKSGVIKKAYADSLQKFIVEAKEKDTNTEDDEGFMTFDGSYKNVTQLDSIQKNAKEEDKKGVFMYWLERKVQIVKDKYKGKNEELKEKFIETVIHNIPKALFLYMPIFAFLLWLFHNKRKWYYFDHGIFTLHYFSFLLLQVLIIYIVDHFLSMLKSPIFEKISDGLTFLSTIWMIYYFYPAHHRFYGGKRRTTVFLGSFLFFLNIIFMIVFITAFITYSLISIT